MHLKDCMLQLILRAPGSHFLNTSNCLSDNRGSLLQQVHIVCVISGHLSACVDSAAGVVESIAYNERLLQVHTSHVGHATLERQGSVVYVSTRQSSNSCISEQCMNPLSLNT